MKKSGFTLVELLAVITILSLVALITSISVANMLKTSKEDLSAAQIKSIELAAKSWGADNITLLPTGNNCSYLTLKDLKDNGLLDSNIIDPKDKTVLSNNLVIKITSKLNSKNKSVLTYKVNDDSISGCSYIGNPILVDVPLGLTPVIYDGENWKVPELNQEWYNYDEQMWANAVVLGSGKTKKPGDVVTVEGENPDALMMLVYIPRYEYKIEGQYGTHTNGTPGTVELPGEIEVKFVNNSKIAADDGYMLHPAFTFGDQEISGFWVGKFELSHETLSSSTTANNLGCSSTSCTNASGLRILPNKVSLRYNNISNFWYGIKSIENTQTFGLNNMDTHMIKNSEWGAVAYLSQSKYGKYGNNDYVGAQKEVYQNKDTGYVTGKSNGTPSQSTSYTQCSYNQKKGTDTNQDQNNCGPGASTTGNIYGVYDMSGGAYESVMGAYGDEQGIYSGYSTSSNSGFNGKTGNDNGNIVNGASVPESKYYDIYKTNNVSTACDNNGPCLGHAMSETASWYGDTANMVSSSYPWFVRGGGYYVDAAHAGVFYRLSIYGSSNGAFSARVVGFGK